MYQWLKERPAATLGAGFALGLLLGIGMLIGALTAQRLGQPLGDHLRLSSVSLDATATDGGDSMAIATGPISDGVEGIFFLDFLTGTLSCSVLNPRTGTLAGVFRHNVVADLGAERGKTPKYLMVTGAANFRATTGSVRPADSVVYVVDENTGRFAAYSLPWNRSAAAYNFAQVNNMVLLGKGMARNLELRE